VHLLFAHGDCVSRSCAVLQLATTEQLCCVAARHYRAIGLLRRVTSCGEETTNKISIDSLRGEEHSKATHAEKRRNFN
jgi:hypothetical protein